MAKDSRLSAEASPPQVLAVFSFITDEAAATGGVGLLQRSLDDGAHHIIARPFATPPGFQPFKTLSLSDTGRWACLGMHQGESVLLIGEIDDFESRPLRVVLEDAGEELRGHGEQVILSMRRGRFAVVDSTSGEITATWNARKGLEPPGHKGEDLWVINQGTQVWVSFQKDSDDGARLGSRLLVMDLPKLELVHDIPLPRDRPDLHIKGNFREQGPNPEKIFDSPSTNTVMLTLDLYGAIAFFDRDAALERGELKDYTVVSAAANGEWGWTFPDRGLLFSVQDQELLLISNAAQNGGLTLFDVSARKPIMHIPTLSGGETPVQVGDRVSTVLSGKVKSRGEEGLIKIFDPENKLVVLDFAARDEQGRPAVLRHDLVGEPINILSVQLEGRVLVLSKVDGMGRASLIDLLTGEVMQSVELPGAPLRVSRWQL
ncbi:MAG: hypothetical protein ACFCU3_01955 [Verrucomicrobiales bacterium]